MINDAVHNLYDLSGKTAVITGGAGLLGVKHAEALLEYGASCVLLDNNENRLTQQVSRLCEQYGERTIGVVSDITVKESVQVALRRCLDVYGAVDILINNAANNPTFDSLTRSLQEYQRFESYPIELWNKDLAVGLTGAFLCSQIFGGHMAKSGGGIILNISSDLGIIAPDQRLYRKEGVGEEEQPTKPVSYSVVKTGLLGLTRYLATYWAKKGIRSNALVPAGVYTGQDEVFVKRISELIPLSRMANENEYKAAIIFLCSGASAYMTGNLLVMDGGRSCW